MALPVKQAADLAKSMADKGLSGSIMMKKPMQEEEMPEEEDGEAYDMEQCVEGVANAVASGDKEEIKSSLLRLVDMIKEEDVEEDQGMEEESPEEHSY